MDEVEQEDFDSVFGAEPQLAYNEQTISSINGNRRTLENELFFDRLMKAIGMDQGSRVSYEAISQSQTKFI